MTTTPKLSPRQRERLLEAYRGSRPGCPGVSYLADQGRGMQAAGAWWRTYKTLAALGLVRYEDSGGSYGVAAFVITEAGHALAEEILEGSK